VDENELMAGNFLACLLERGEQYKTRTEETITAYKM